MPSAGSKVTVTDSNLGLVRWRSTTPSPWPRWRMWWTDRISVVVLRRLLAWLPLLLRGWIPTRVCPRLGLGTRVERLSSGVWGVLRHRMTAFAVVRVRSGRIRWRLCAEKHAQEWRRSETINWNIAFGDKSFPSVFHRTYPLTVRTGIVMVLVLRVWLPSHHVGLLCWATLAGIMTRSRSLRVSTVERVGWVESSCGILTLCWAVDAIWICSMHCLRKATKGEEWVVKCLCVCVTVTMRDNLLQRVLARECKGKVKRHLRL